MSLLAPPLPPQQRRAGKFFRIVSGMGLLASAALLLLANIVLCVAVYFAVIPEVSPQELYHRAWQMARDNIYDQDRLQDWDKWEHKYDSQIKTDEDAVRYSREMIESLDERYTFILDKQEVQREEQEADGHFIGVGVTFEVELEETGEAVETEDGQVMLHYSDDGFPIFHRVYRGSPAQKAGLQPGDHLLFVNSDSVGAMSMDALVSKLKGERGSSVKLRVRRNGSEFDLTIVRDEVSIPIVTTAHLPDGIGYIRLEGFDRWDTAEQFAAGLKELSDCRALIVDVRDNPGGFIHSAVEVSAMFLDSGVITTMHTRVPGSGYLKYSVVVSPGAMGVRLDSTALSGLTVKLPYRPANLSAGKPVVLLVDGSTASAAELFAAALQDNGRVKVVGTTTFGKGIGQTYVPVGNGVRLRITNLRSYTPAGRWIGNGGQGVANGVQPDVVVPGNPESTFGDANDRQLEVAKKLLSVP